MCDTCLKGFIRPEILFQTELSVAHEKEQPQQDLMYSCTTQSSFGRAMPMALATPRPIVGFTKRSYRTKEITWTFDVDLVNLNNRVALLTIVPSPWDPGHAYKIAAPCMRN